MGKQQMSLTIFFLLATLQACSDNTTSDSKIDSTSVASNYDIDVSELDSHKLVADSNDTVSIENLATVDTYPESYTINDLSKDSMQIKFNHVGETVRIHGQKYNNQTQFKDNAQFLFEGDILIDYSDRRVAGFAVAETATGNLWQQRNANGKPVIPYYISPTYRFPERIFQAINLWSKSTGIEFRRINFPSGIADFLYFTRAPQGCKIEGIGRDGGTQYVLLADDCQFGNIAHELGHALGLFHEQTRSDRDKYITLNKDGIGKWAFQFKLADASDGLPKDIGDYDFYSIMHYPEAHFFKVKSPYADTLPRSVPGQRRNLSRGDIAAVKSLYKLP